MKKEKVVFLDGIRKSTAKPQRYLPRLMEQIRDYSINELNQYFNEMLDNADDVFFDLADKACSNADQSLYFNSMRELRIMRKRMAKVFEQELNNNFLVLQNIEKSIDDDKSEPLPIDSLSLVQEDELEESLALDSMVGKANALHKLELHQIVTRLDTLLANLRIDKSNNPLGPKLICKSFSIAAEALEINIKAKLVIFKLFDRLVVAKFGKLYEGINNFLIDSGVLPDLVVNGTAYKNRFINKRRANQESSEVEQGFYNQSTDDDSEPDMNFLGALKSLLESQKTEDRTTTVNKKLTAKRKHLVDNNQLVKALSTIQADSQQQPLAEISSLSAVDLRGQLAFALPNAGPLSSQNIGQTNDDIIDIISLLFDFILDDKNLPDVFKALIGRLQIPILKVAIIDQTFLSKGNHPARKLLNEMAHAGVGWTENAETGSFGLCAKVEKIVAKIIDEFDDDTSLFADALIEFHEFMEAHRNRTSLLERRIEEAEEGKAKIEMANIKAKEALLEEVGNYQLPQAINKIIFDVWQSVLALNYLREGNESDAWGNNLQVIEELMDSLAPAKTQQAKKTLAAKIPDLLKSLSTGLDAVGYGEFESLQLLKELEKIHTKVLKGEVVLGVLDQKGEAVSPPRQSYTYEDMPIPSLEELSLELAKFENNKEIKIESGETEQSTVELNELTIIDEENAFKEPGSYFDSSLMDHGSIHEDDEVMILVSSLLAGSWFELIVGHRSSRVKLAAIISSIGKYIFVNNTGKKIAEYSKLELALEFRRGNITQLDDGALFERALKSIVSNLRTQKQCQDAGL